MAGREACGNSSVYLNSVLIPYRLVDKSGKALSFNGKGFHLFDILGAGTLVGVQIYSAIQKLYLNTVFAYLISQHTRIYRVFVALHITKTKNYDQRFV